VAIINTMSELLDLLEREDTKRIILATYISPKSANELSFKLGISITKIYHVLKKLELFGLMESKDPSFNGRGRPKKVYQAKLRNARMVMDNDRMMIQFELPQEYQRYAAHIEVAT
jgi:predicted transcriptional regulator